MNAMSFSPSYSLIVHSNCFLFQTQAWSAISIRLFALANCPSTFPSFIYLSVPLSLSHAALIITSATSTCHAFASKLSSGNKLVYWACFFFFLSKSHSYFYDLAVITPLKMDAHSHTQLSLSTQRWGYYQEANSIHLSRNEGQHYEWRIMNVLIICQSEFSLLKCPASLFSATKWSTSSAADVVGVKRLESGSALLFIQAPVF